MTTETTNEIAAELARACRAFRSTVDRLAPGDVDRPMAAGWTPKEMLGHMAFWGEAVEPVVVAMIRGDALRDDWAFGSGYEPSEGEEWPMASVHNEREAAWAARRPYAEVLARLDAAHDRAVEIAAGLTEEEVVDDRFRSYFAEKSGHFAEHQAELEQHVRGATSVEP